MTTGIYVRSKEELNRITTLLLEVGQNTRFKKQPETRIEGVCANCGREFWRYRSNIRSETAAQYCSQECYLASIKGKNNPNWNGGRKAWFRQGVLEKDNYTCQLCGERDTTMGFMDTDHIIPKSQSPELEFNIQNGQTLCPNCHRRKSLAKKDYSHKDVAILLKGEMS